MLLLPRRFDGWMTDNLVGILQGPTPKLALQCQLDQHLHLVINLSLWLSDSCSSPAMLSILLIIDKHTTVCVVAMTWVRLDAR